MCIRDRKRIDTTQYPYILEKPERCRSASMISRKSRNIYIPISNPEPKKPHSSPTVQKIKSELCLGTNLNFVWVPCRKPFPAIPPEPIEIIDWFTLYPVP